MANKAFEYHPYEYTPYSMSAAARDALTASQSHSATRPGEYQSQWQAQLNDLCSQIQGRQPFSYDLNGDALYQQYKQQYINQGKMAMTDTMGQAAAMTGGYGNSYAQSAGQQTYQNYLNQLNDKIPELYQLALDTYNQEGTDLYNRYSMAASREDQDYSRYRDTVSDWNADQDRLDTAYRYESEQDYNRWQDWRDFEYNRYGADRAQAYQQYRDDISDQQWQANFDEAQRQWNQLHPTSTASSGGSGGSGGGGGTTPTTTPTTTGFTGSTYSEACAYVSSHGGSSGSIMTQSEWQRHRNAYQSSGGTQGGGAGKFPSYALYLQGTVEYIVPSQTSK